LTLRAELSTAAERARYYCTTKDECQKAFSLTQIFISENADMKIQVATDTIVETYNATQEMNVALKAIKIPGAGTSSQIALSGNCKGLEREPDGISDLCVQKMLRIFRAYPDFMRDSVQK
jgi:hypothetical protein